MERGQTTAPWGSGRNSQIAAQNKTLSAHHSWVRLTKHCFVFIHSNFKTLDLYILCQKLYFVFPLHTACQFLSILLELKTLLCYLETHSDIILQSKVIHTCTLRVSGTRAHNRLFIMVHAVKVPRMVAPSRSICDDPRDKLQAIPEYFSKL